MKQHIFRTVIPPVESAFKMSYKSQSIFVGSCFSENIGNLLKKYKFSVDINPFGILFNPVSVASSLNLLIEKKKFEGKDLVFHNEQWHSFYHHGRFSDIHKYKVIESINERILNPVVDLKDADFLFITFGTAWVYQWNETGIIVSNCHKFPNGQFTRKRLTIKETTDIYTQLFNGLFKKNPKIQIILSLSPVRHIKDGFRENLLSKSILRVVIDELERSYHNVHYFPAYEIVTDDLRDYRYYSEDMIHPNDISIKYIFDYFSNCFFDIETQGLHLKIKQIIKAIEHVPFSKESVTYKEFISGIHKELMLLSDQYPNIDFSNEIQTLNQ